MMNQPATLQISFSKIDDTSKLRNQITQASLPGDLVERLLNDLDRLEREIKVAPYRLEFDQQLKYIQFVSTLPFSKGSPDILDLKRAQQILDKNHYGLVSVKERILEYLAQVILNYQEGRKLHSQVLSFVGLVGSGKTSLAYSIAESLGRKLIRIPFGGLGSVADLRGESLSEIEAEPGRIMKSIQMIGVNNPVILLDELDRIAEEARSDVMGVLVELLDPEQNWAFWDHYVDYPFDLSNVLFITTANNSANIATAVLDRLEIIEMPSYSDEEKIIIGKNYLLPKAIEESGLKEGMVNIDDALWPTIVRPLGYDGGIRSLQRNIQAITRRVAKAVVLGDPGPYHITEENSSQFLGE